jgi:hypothetical protein
MNLENVWNSTDRENSKYSERSLFQCQFVHHVSVIYPVLCGEKLVTDCLNHDITHEDHEED